MADAVLFKTRGIKCDADGCDYRDDMVTLEQLESFLNAPCPKCGANLLTPEDLLTVKLIAATAGWFNAVCGPVADDVKREVLRIKMDGSGRVQLDSEAER